MRILTFSKNIFLVETTTARELGLIFCRMQEFYESPSKKFKGRYFKLEDFQKWYAETQSETGKFTYGEDFGGYNVPSHTLYLFSKSFGKPDRGLTAPEKKILSKVLPAARHEKCYLIGIVKGDKATLKHELHHAFYYLSSDYQLEIKSLVNRYFTFDDIKGYLKSKMYCPEVYTDETAAYLMFEGAILRKEAGINTRRYDHVAKELRKIFYQYKRKLL